MENKKQGVQRNYAKVVREVGDIPNVRGRLRVRIVRYEQMWTKSDPLLDVRVYIDRDTEERGETGWTRTGLTLRKEQVERLHAMLGAILSNGELNAVP